MATFCLLLAVAAFVLAGGPSLCHGDRPRLAGTFYRSPNGANGYGPDSIWSIVGGEPDTGGAHGLRLDDRITKLAFASQTTLCQRAVAAAEELIVLESLLGRYRKYIVDEFARFDDVCSLLNEVSGDDAVPGVAAESYNDSVETSLGQAFAGQTDDASGSGKEKTSNTDRNEDLSAATLKMMFQPLGDYCSSNAKRFYRCLLEHINDQQLMGLIHEHLQTTCILRGPLLFGNNMLDKRDGPRYVSKQKFHSWGGKRTGVRPHKQPKVVIRNPFHSWGGKRSEPGSDILGAAQ